MHVVRCGALALALLAVRAPPARAAYSAVVQSDLDEMTTAITALIESYRESGDDNEVLGAKIMRLQFNDCAGGCDGCINTDNEDNAGLEVPMEQLEAIYTDSENGFSTKMSRADFWALASNIAGAHAAENGGGYEPTWVNNYGRQDHEDCSADGTYTKINLLPGGDIGLDIMLTYFSEQFGLTEREVVAVMGAHSVGKATVTNSGYWGAWTPSSQGSLSNQYYTAMMDSSGELLWTQKHLRESGVWQWEYESAVTDEGMMMNADMALWLDLGEVQEDGEVLCGSYAAERIDKCGESSVADIVTEFAADNELWLSEFAAAMAKIASTGYESGCLETIATTASSYMASNEGQPCPLTDPNPHVLSNGSVSVASTHYHVEQPSTGEEEVDNSPCPESTDETALAMVVVGVALLVVVLVVILVTLYTKGMFCFSRQKPLAEMEQEQQDSQAMIDRPQKPIGIAASTGGPTGAPPVPPRQ